MTQYGLLIDYEFCTGCQSCEVSCKEEHDFPVGKWGIRVLDDGPWQKDDSKNTGNCYNWNKIPTPTDLCDLCVNRLRDGREPVCMHNCLADVIRFGTINEMAEELKRKPKQVLWTPCDIEL